MHVKVHMHFKTNDIKVSLILSGDILPDTFRIFILNIVNLIFKTT